MTVSAVSYTLFSFVPGAGEGGRYRITLSGQGGRLKLYDSDGSGSVTLSISKAPAGYSYDSMIGLGGTISAAMYDINGRMLKYLILTDGVLPESTVPPGTETIKLFCLDSELKPKCDSETPTK